MELKTAVEEYVRRKRLMGRRYENNSKELHTFARTLQLPLNEVRVAHVSDYLNRSRLARNTWLGRYSRLRAFFNYWIAKHEITRLPMPRPRRATNCAFSPYIYSLSDIREILRKADAHDLNLSIVSAQTLRMLVIFLYATGVGPGEALALKRKDLDFQGSTVTLSARPGPPRTIPIGPDLLGLLKTYVGATRKTGDYLFKTKKGQPIKSDRIKVVFRRVRQSAKIRRSDCAFCQPALRDLRHTFAVHRIMDWYEKGIDVERMMPKLAAYMGVWNFRLVDRYLSLAPPHFRKQVTELSREVTNKRDGKIIGVQRLTAAPDGETIHATYENKEADTTTSSEMRKQR
jgi:integrase/recombinase XerD